MPDWIPTRAFRTVRRGGETRMVDFPLVNSPEALLWMVQMNCIDMNAWYSRVDSSPSARSCRTRSGPPGTWKARGSAPRSLTHARSRHSTPS